MYSLDTRCHSEIGLVRKMNQDSGYVSGSMLLVADGMGGAAAGDIASTIAIQELAKVDQRLDGEQMIEALAGALTKANDEVCDINLKVPETVGMGSTVSGCMFSGTQYGVANIGDSRTYILRDGELIQVTHDDSLVQSLLDEGKLTKTEAEHHPHRSLLLKVINGETSYVPDFQVIDAKLGDRVLVCSDGLCGLVMNPHIEAILNSCETLDEALDELIKAAHAAGGNDNITVILADVVEHSEALDAAEPQVIGAAATTDPHALVAQALAHTNLNERNDNSTPTAGADQPASLESAKASVQNPASTPVADDHKSQKKNRRKRTRTALLSSLGALAVLGGVCYGGYVWTQNQYYVGESDGMVAIYQGVNGSVLSFSFSHVEEETDIKVSDLPRHYREQVASTITVADMTSARSTVSELRGLAEYCIQLRRDMSAQPSASPSGDNPGSTAPGGDGSAGLGTPAVNPLLPGSTPAPSATVSPTPTPHPSATTTPQIDLSEC